MSRISYNKLWKLLIDEGMKKKDLREKACVSGNTLSKMGRGETVSLEVLIKICNVLNCDIGDVVEIVRDKAE